MNMPFIRHLVFAIFFAMLNLPYAAAKEENKALASAQEIALAAGLPKNEVLWLENTSGKFLSLQREHLSKTRRGIAILLPEIATTLINPDYIEPLRHSLNQVGWATLSITPPATTLLSVSPAQKEIQSAYAQELVERVNKALEWAKKSYQYSVVIAQGRQLAYLIDALTQQHLQPIDALVIINAQPAFAQPSDKLKLRYPDQQQLFSKQLTALQIPVLDINQTNRSEPTVHLELRERLANKQLHPNYRQVRFLTRDNYSPATKSIYGWLTNSGLR